MTSSPVATSARISSGAKPSSSATSVISRVTIPWRAASIWVIANTSADARFRVNLLYILVFTVVDAMLLAQRAKLLDHSLRSREMRDRDEVRQRHHQHRPRSPIHVGNHAAAVNHADAFGVCHEQDRKTGDCQRNRDPGHGGLVAASGVMAIDRRNFGRRLGLGVMPGQRAFGVGL